MSLSQERIVSKETVDRLIYFSTFKYITEDQKKQCVGIIRSVLEDSFGYSRSQINRWFMTPNIGLGDNEPRQLIGRGDGDLIIKMLSETLVPTVGTGGALET